MTPHLRKLFFETLYKNHYLYRFASTVPFAGQWRIWQGLILSRIHGHDVLELGCGLGDLLADMLEAGYMCRAVEQSPQMVAAARATLTRRHAGVPSWVIQGSAQKLPFSPHSFDTVVSTFPSDYIHDADTLSEIERVLRPGGRLIVIEGAHLEPVSPLQSFLLLIQWLVYGSGTFAHDHRASAAKKTAENTTNADHATVFTTTELPGMPFGKLIPLEQFGFSRRSQQIHSRRWQAFITIGEKSAPEIVSAVSE
jgi:ubiquinone/menaquinone biosynthesis C-methylase UbiE